MSVLKVIMAENVAQKRRADVMENKENVENMQISSKGRLPAVLAEFDIEGAALGSPFVLVSSGLIVC